MASQLGLNQVATSVAPQSLLAPQVVHNAPAGPQVVSNAPAGPQVVHNAPAGSKYKSIKDAGRTLLDANFDGYLKGLRHEMIPPIYMNKCTEETASDGLIVPRPGLNQSDLVGLNREKVGAVFCWSFCGQWTY